MGGVSESNLERWLAGVPLSAAWLRYAEPHAADGYRAAETQGSLEARRIMLVVDLWASLSDGDLAAFGKRVSPALSDGPVQIPVHTFHDRPDAAIGDTDNLEVAGWRYEAVRIAPVIHTVAPTKAAAAKRGPKPIAPLVKAAIDHLRQVDPIFDDRSQAKRIEAIRAEVAAQNPGLFPKRHLPGYTTIWNYVSGRKLL